MEEEDADETTSQILQEMQQSSTTSATRMTSNVSVVQKIRVQSQIRSFKTSSKQYLSQQSNQSSIAEEDDGDIVPQCQIITHQASGDSCDSNESSKSDTKLTAGAIKQKVVTQRYGLLQKSPNSSSSQEDYEPEIKQLYGKQISGQYLSASSHVETAKSMESLRTSISPTPGHTATRGSFLTSSERDMRRVMQSSVEAKSLESLEREIRMKRRAVSGEELTLGISNEEIITAEKRRGLFAGIDRRSNVTPQHLSLPPPGGAPYSLLSPGDRRITILSPHSPHHTPDLLQFSHSSLQTLRTRRKKAIVLPRLVLPRSDSEISEVFLDHDLS